MLAAALVLPSWAAAQPVDDADVPRNGPQRGAELAAEADAYPDAGVDAEVDAGVDAEADAGVDAEADDAPREPGIELPDGPGRALVLSACMPCHNLAGIAAFKGYWNREQWAAMVATMIGHGAKLDASETDVVVAYLTAHFGVTENQRQRGLADESTDTSR